MPTTITRYKILLSAPSDTVAECKAAEEELLKINRTHCSETGIDFFPTDWRRDSRADSGDEPQQLLNKQIVEDADIILAIFKERFGTPTSQYGSGTEEEIFLGLEMKKPVLVYFWNPPEGFIPQDASQFASIEILKTKLQSRVIYQTFSDTDKLRSQVRHDFTKLMFDLENKATSANPSLAISGINLEDEILADSTPLIFPHASTFLNIAALDKPVLEAYEKVIETELPKPDKTTFADGKAKETTNGIDMRSINPQFQKMASKLSAQNSIFSSHTVDISQSDQNLVREELSTLNLNIEDDLFNLGELRESDIGLSVSFGHQGRNLSGSDEEKEKYKNLQTLIKKCKDRKEFLAFLKNSENIGVVSFAITNTGSAPAHHVNVDIELPISYVVMPDQIPSPSSYFVGHVLDTQSNCEKFIEILFQLKETATYRDYADSQVRTESGFRVPPTLISPPINPMYGTRYLESSDYDELIEYEFGDYSYIKDERNDKMVIRLSFDVIQQGFSYAFPTRIPVRGTSISSIHYVIRADELENACKGDLMVTEMHT